MLQMPKNVPKCPKCLTMVVQGSKKKCWKADVACNQCQLSWVAILFKHQTAFLSSSRTWLRQSELESVKVRVCQSRRCYRSSAPSPSESGMIRCDPVTMLSFAGVPSSSQSVPVIRFYIKTEAVPWQWSCRPVISGRTVPVKLSSSFSRQVPAHPTKAQLIS